MLYTKRKKESTETTAGLFPDRFGKSHWIGGLSVKEKVGWVLEE